MNHMLEFLQETEYVQWWKPECILKY